MIDRCPICGRTESLGEIHRCAPSILKRIDRDNRRAAADEPEGTDDRGFHDRLTEADELFETVDD